MSLVINKYVGRDLAKLGHQHVDILTLQSPDVLNTLLQSGSYVPNSKYCRFRAPEQDFKADCAPVYVVAAPAFGKDKRKFILEDLMQGELVNYIALSTGIQQENIKDYVLLHLNVQADTLSTPFMCDDAATFLKHTLYRDQLQHWYIIECGPWREVGSLPSIAIHTPDEPGVEILKANEKWLHASDIVKDDYQRLLE